MLLLARESRFMYSGSRSMPFTSRASCMARAAYFRTWVVSIPEISSKNQPSLEYMSIACLCISSSLRAFTSSASEGSLAACLTMNLNTFSGDLSSTTSI
ncbi:Uncharacterised protein [uncultured archaeon]|nr:Uncharacterised protein [uncultured archaeon]